MGLSSENEALLEKAIAKIGPPNILLQNENGKIENISDLSFEDDREIEGKEEKNERQTCKRVVQVSLLLGALPLLFVFVLLPLLIYFCPHVMQNLFFLNFRKIPMTDYENVSANNVKSTGRSFYLQGEQGKIGVWHMWPRSLSARYHDKNIIPTGEEMEESLSKEVYPVVLYAHGNSFDRTIDHRCQLYNVLNDMNYQVIAFDYRGYGDSEGTPTEEGLVADSRLVFEYLRKKVGKNLLIIWGHSMGTGVSTKLVQDLSKESKAPDGLILESPFNNLHDAVMNHPFSFNIEQTLIAMGFSPIRWMPDTLVNLLILNPLRSVGLNMNSDQRIVDITCPIFIIHAEDDHVIPAKLGRLLRDAAKQAERDVEYLEFPSNRQFKHKFIYLADELPTHVRTFFAKCDKLRHGNNSQRLD